MICSRTLLLLMLLALLFIASAGAQTWNVVASGIDTNLRGVSVVGDAHERAVVWASGSNGVVIVSKDEGQHWKRLTVQGGETLDFRGIAALSESTAYLMSSGEGEKSRIYKTTDGGASWKLQYSDDRKDFFLDAIQCLSETDCYALGDPMDRKFVLPRTKDGEHWEPMPTAAMPAALPQEGAFAASNSCLRVDSKNRIYFVTGGPAARMFHSGDMGATWQVSELPLAKGNPSSGAFSIAVSRENIVVAGGDYRKAEQSSKSAAYSMDGGATWKQATLLPGGFRSTVASAEGTRFIVAGPNGSDVSMDHGEHWKRIDSGNWNAVAMNEFGTWAVGPKGTVARLQ